MTYGIYGDDLAHVHHAGFGTFARGAATGLLEYLRRAGLSEGRVVDLACGSGIWARELLSAGFEVLGIDVSPAMIDLAKEIAPGGRFVVGSVHTAEIPPCTAATAIGEGISYLADDEDAVDPRPLFHRVHEALVPGGLFIFDVVEKVLDDPMSYQTSRSGADWKVMVDVSEDLSSSLLSRRITTTRNIDGGIQRTTELHRLQTFQRVELDRTLRDYGYLVHMVRRYGAAVLPPRRLGVIAQKRQTSHRPFRGPQVLTRGSGFKPNRTGGHHASPTPYRGG